MVSAVTAAVAPRLKSTPSVPPPTLLGPGDVPVRLTVNGKRLDLMIEPRVTLLDALRMRADLTGNKRVCDRGTCGACTMIVDDRAVYSCSTLAIEVQGKQIRTVDGLANGAALHPVQQAFCDADALMCGFCTPGFHHGERGAAREAPLAPSRADSDAASTGTSVDAARSPRIFEAVSSVKGVKRA